MHEIDYTTVPVSYMASGLQLYVERGIEPGGFMQALLKNQLTSAMQQADSVNSTKLSEWITWLNNHLPTPCWGNEESYNRWVESGGMNNIYK